MTNLDIPYLQGLLVSQIDSTLPRSLNYQPLLSCILVQIRGRWSFNRVFSTYIPAQQRKTTPMYEKRPNLISLLISKYIRTMINQRFHCPLFRQSLSMVLSFRRLCSFGIDMPSYRHQQVQQD